MNIDERNILLLAFNQKNQTKKGVAQMSEHKTHVSAHLEIDLTCNQEKENNHQLLSRKVMFFIFFLCVMIVAGLIVYIHINNVFSETVMVEIRFLAVFTSEQTLS